MLVRVSLILFYERLEQCADHWVLSAPYVSPAQFNNALSYFIIMITCKLINSFLQFSLCATLIACSNADIFLWGVHVKKAP